MNNRKTKIIKLSFCAMVIISLTISPILANIPIANDKSQTWQLYYSPFVNQIDTIETNVNQHIDIIATDLSASTEFTLKQTEEDQVPIEMHAKYFSCTFGGICYDDNGIDNITVNGYIWSDNGTFTLCYTAILDPNNLQVLQVNIYQPFSTTNATLQVPQLKNFKVYSIQDMSNIEIIPDDTLSSTDDPNLEDVSPLWAQYTSYNWCGYEFYKGGGPLPTITSATSSSMNVVQLSLGDRYIYPNPIAVVAWVGASYYHDGTPYLYQGGWGGSWSWTTGFFSYFTWVDRAPDYATVTPITVSPGDSISTTIFYNSANNRVYVTVQKGSVSYTKYWTTSSDAVPRFAEYMVETPWYPQVSMYAWLPRWSGEINHWNPTINIQGTNYKGSYFISHDWWYGWILQRTTTNNTQCLYHFGTNEYISTTYITSR